MDEVAEWLRRWTANPMCSAREGSNPFLVGIFFREIIWRLNAGISQTDVQEPPIVLADFPNVKRISDTGN